MIGRSSGLKIHAGLAAALLAVFLLMLNYLSARHYRRADWTRSKVFSISEKTEKTLRALQKDVQVTVFLFAGGGDYETAELRKDVQELLERFQRYSSKVHVEMIDPDRDPKRTQLLAQQYEIKAEDLELGGIVVFAAGKKHKYVTRDDIAEYAADEELGGASKLVSFKGEGAFLNAMLAVTEGEQPELCFTSGHTEAAIDSADELGLSALDEELKRDNYKTRTLDERALEKPIDKTCAVVVIAGPQRAFAQVEIDTLDAYLRGGGRVLLLLGPVIDGNLERFQEIGIESFVERWGIHVGANIVVDDAGIPGLYQYLSWVTRNGWSNHPIGVAMRNKPVIFTLPREVRAKGGEGLEVRDIVKSSERGWGETSLAFLRQQGELRFDPATDVKGPVNIAAAVESAQGGGRLVVIGTVDFVANSQLRGPVRDRDYGRDFMLATLGWLLKQEARVAVGPKAPENFKLQLDQNQLSTIFFVSFVFMPLAALGIGAAVWWRRRK